jgi:hypothetical protein
MKSSWKLTLFGRTVIFQLHVLKTPKDRTWGKSSRIPHTINHVLFLDYDYVDERTMVDEVQALQQEFEFGNVAVFQTKAEHSEDERPVGGYHCVCIDHFVLNEVKRIVMSSSCDLGFVMAPRYDRFRNWVLRDSEKGSREKPKFKYLIISPHEGKRKQSSAHAFFLQYRYGVKLNLLNSDGLRDFQFESYQTANRT